MTKPLIILSLFLAPLTATAGAKKVPEYDLSPDELLKSAKKWKFKTESKPKTYPKKVAIGYFQVRYNFVNATGTTTVKFGASEYELLTNQLYAQLQARLEAEGFEVVPRKAVVESTAYGAIDQDEKAKANEKRFLYSPSGMKILPTFSGRPRNLGALAPLNPELGTDAVVAAFVSVGTCDVEPTKKTANRNGTFPCIKGDLTMPGFNINFVGAPKNEKSNKPAWTARVYKETEIIDYNKKENLAYDMALIPMEASTKWYRKGFWKSGYNADVNDQAFISGTSEVYDHTLMMGFEVWESKNGKAREAAGMKRSPVLDPVPDADFSPAAVTNVEPAPVLAPIGPMTGTMKCYWTEDKKAKTASLLHRAIDKEKGQIIEDVISYAKGEANFRAGTLWTIDGSEAVLREAQDFWTGTATFDGDPWSAESWKVNLTMKNTMIVDASYSMDGDAVVSTTVMTVNDTEAGRIEGRMELIDEASCLEKIAAVKIPTQIQN